MFYASASAPPVSLSGSSGRARRAAADRSSFCDALRYAYDIAYRPSETLSLAQRAAYGLFSCDPRVGRRTDLGGKTESATFDCQARPSLCAIRKTIAADCERKTGSSSFGRNGRPQHGNQGAAYRAKHRDAHQVTTLDRKGRPLRSYFRFKARVDGIEIVGAVASGRVFAGVQSWTR